MKVLWLFVLLFSGIASATEPEQALVRILISKNLRKLTVEADDLTIINRQTQKTVLRFDSAVRATIIGRKTGFEINGTLVEADQIRIESKSGFVKVAKKKLLHSPIDLIHHRQNDFRFLLVNPVPLEDYVAGLINREVLPSWPLEAKKAMAVAARTYTLFRKLDPKSPYYDLSDTAIDQVYGGFDAEDLESRIAVAQTRGEVLVWGAMPIEAYYHSTCGGRTVSAKETWGTDIPYLKSRKCDYCKDSPKYRWTVKIPRAEIERKLKLKAVRNIHVLNRGEAGQALEVEILTAKGSVRMRADKFRSAIGYNRIWSTKFSVHKKGNTFVFKGRGSGHGVGLCQWGAYGLAKRGWDYKRILQYYYPGTKLKKIY